MASGTMSGSGTALDPYLVEDALDLKAIESYGYDKYYKQANDFELGTFEPVGYASGSGYTAFTGNYDGNGKTISNGTISYPTTDYYIGIFAFLNNGSIYDLTIDNVNVTGYRLVGSLIGYKAGNSSSIHDIEIKNSTIISGNPNVGGLCGYGADYGEVYNITINTCVVTMTSNNDSCGGVFGGYSNNNSTYFNFYNWQVLACTISGFNTVGGLVGYMEKMRSTSVSSLCFSNMYVDENTTVTASNIQAGGIFGSTGSYVRIDKCVNKANITAGVYNYNSYVGGLIGYSTQSYVYDSYNTGTVYGAGRYCGGITGFLVNSTTSMERCYNSGNITGVQYVGGIIGIVYSAVTINACYALNSSITRLSGTAVDFGRIAGINYGTVTNCYALDTMVLNY